MGQQRGGDDQRLGDGGVGDLLGRRGGAEPGQVQAAGLRPRVERSAAPGSSSHGGEHAGGLRSLSGGKQRNHGVGSTD